MTAKIVPSLEEQRFDPQFPRSQTTPRSSSTYSLHRSGHLYLSLSSLSYPSSSQSSVTNASTLSDDDDAVVPIEAKGIRHPIHDLVANATLAWEAKLKRQSTTLLEAVVEYKRRHKRNPPKGFDLW